MYSYKGERIRNNDDDGDTDEEHLQEWLDMNGNAYLIQGTNVAGNLDIERGKTIYPGNDLNGSEQENWLETQTDYSLIYQANNGPLWPMYPTGGGETLGGTEDTGNVMHPGVRFNQEYGQ